VREKTRKKQLLREDRAVGRAICAEKVHRGDPKGAVRGPKQAFRGKNLDGKQI